MNVQAMVFGNTGENSGSGVRVHARSGHGKSFHGEFPRRAGAKDVVAGAHAGAGGLVQKQQPKRLPGAARGQPQAISRTCRISSSPSGRQAFML